MQATSTPRLFVFPEDPGDGYWGWSAPRRAALVGRKGRRSVGPENHRLMIEGGGPKRAAEIKIHDGVLRVW